MANSETADVDSDVAEKFFSGLRSNRVTPSDIALVADDPHTLRALSYVLRDALPALRAQADKKQRNEYLLMDVNKLALDDSIAAKLVDGRYGKVFRVAMARREELTNIDLSDSEIDQVISALESINLEIRADTIELPEQILRLWHTWASVPTPVRIFYGI